MSSSMGGSKGYGEKIPHGYKQGRVQQYTPEQMELYGSQYQHLSPDSYLSRLAGGDEDIFNEIEAPALRQFNEIQGGLASRFSGMGMGARRSSGFQNTSTQAASDFAQQLQSQRQSLRQTAINDLMSLSNQVLNQKPYENYLVKKEEKVPFWKQVLGMGSPVGGDIANGNLNNTTNFFNTASKMAV